MSRIGKEQAVEKPFKPETISYYPTVSLLMQRQDGNPNYYKCTQKTKPVSRNKAIFSGLTITPSVASREVVDLVLPPGYEFVAAKEGNIIGQNDNDPNYTHILS